MGRRVLVLVLLVLGCSTPRADRVGFPSVPAAERCRALPELIPLGVRSADCSSPYNSDRSAKHLAPAPPSFVGRTVLFRFDDFGPSSMQLGLLGDAWWSWEGGGSWEICDEFDIRVVVHRGALDEAIRAHFATVQGKADYRFIERDAALRYLDARIAELSQPMDPEEFDFGPLRRRLELTRRTIDECTP